MQQNKQPSSAAHKHKRTLRTEQQDAGQRLQHALDGAGGELKRVHRLQHLLELRRVVHAVDLRAACAVWVKLQSTQQVRHSGEVCEKHLY